MELQQLRYFLEVASTQHMTKSAEKLHISQPSLSQSIKRLESELGVKLFSSSGRGIVLTECGIFFRDKLDPLIKRIDALGEQVRQVSDSQHSIIHLHVTAASLLVSEAIIDYRSVHENTSFQFLLGDDDSLFDISVESLPSPPAENELGQEVYACSEEIFLAVPNSLARRMIAPVKLRDFENSDFISLIANKSFRQTCDGLCAQAGFRPRIAFESDNPDTVRNMISANMGVGFWPAFTWGHLQRDNVSLLDICEPVCRRYIVIKMQKNRMDNQAVEEFFTFLCHLFDVKISESFKSRRG